MASTSYKAVQLYMCSHLLSACMSTAGSDVATARAAHIIEPNAITRAELLNVVQRALDNNHITLADNALTDSNRLIIERAKLVAADGSRLNGRESAPPEQFTLIKQGRRCVLIHERTNVRSTLGRTQCIAMQAPPN